MMAETLIALGVAALCFAAVWIPARRGNLWARFVAWGAIVFVMAVLFRLVRSGYTPPG
jgi:glycerol uptake facilitator-like aquaporin